MAQYEVKSLCLPMTDLVHVPFVKAFFFFLSVLFWVSAVLQLLLLTLMALFIWYITLAASSEIVCIGWVGGMMH